MEVSLEKNTDLLQRYIKVRQHSIDICRPLGKEDYVVQPVVDVSPPKWHLAHVTWFFETFLLIPFKDDYELFDDDYSYVFNSYYESVGSRVLRADRGNLTRPNVEEVYAYRAYVDQAMEHLLQGSHRLGRRFFEIMEIGLQHEQQHQELLVTDIKYILGHNPLFPSYFPPQKHSASTSTPRKPDFLEVPQGIYRIGCEEKRFCFDNELGVHQVHLHSFKIMDRLVTNQEYLEFIEAGGYSDFRYWLMEGWEWVQSENCRAPMYWYQLEGVWHSYNLSGLEALDPLAPVTHVNFYEAEAYARWKGMRLPTEFEWEAACKMYQREIPENSRFQENYSFLPAAATADNYQFFGDAWEWTNSAYLPYPYFQKEEGALGEYNGKFMVSQMVLRGGSCATPRDHIRASYRNFFHPYLRWQFTGIRLASHI